MQLSVTTDYGIRIVLYLIKNNEVTSSAILSEKLDIPKTYVLKVTKKLEAANIVACYQGVNGGVNLLPRPEEISLWDVVIATETTTAINKCLDTDGCCNRHAEDTCKVREVYLVLQKAVEERMQNIKLIDLAE
ncbi:Rrf2 family protein [Lachnospiraceae bacterium 2_1_46FAA]|nr:Rrf2 family protein [Lachnospiraceae bacterium 2_1_46FAA]